MDDQEISTGEALDASPASPFDLTTLAILMQDCVQEGWVWDEKTHKLIHPHDGLLYFAVDPASHRLSLSPKLARQLYEAEETPQL